MNLDLFREVNEGRGKYALFKVRALAKLDVGGLPRGIYNAIRTLENAGVWDWGEEGSESEFFVIRLKDKHAFTALVAYADSADRDDEEWAGEIYELADKAGHNHPNCERPD